METKQAVLEGAKEVLRLAFFAAISAALAAALEYFGALDQTNVMVVVATVALRFVDKVVHEDKSIQANGVAPF